MEQSIEIEFKNMLTQKEYQYLLEFFKITQDEIIIQENHYFDTAAFDLKNARSALRIREKQNQFEMTLKQPAEVGLLETSQALTRKEAESAILFGKIPEGIIQQVLEGMNIPFAELEYFGSLITKRVEKKVNNGLLVLDHSQYLNKEDFELEYEVLDFEQGQKDFLTFLNDHGIPKRKTENKIMRFYNQKLHQKN